MSLKNVLFVAGLVAVGGCTFGPPTDPCFNQQPVARRTPHVQAHDEAPNDLTVQCYPDSPGQP